MEQTYYDRLTSRNYLFIDDILQEKIKATKLCFLGCGLGGNIAIAAARLGFQNFILCDDDLVSIENLNRQPYFYRVVNTEKIYSLRDQLMQINNETKISTFFNRITIDSIKDYHLEADIFINTIDYGPDYVHVTDYLSQTKGHLVVAPANIGFGSLILNFSSNSSSFSNIVGNDYSMENIIFSSLAASNTAFSSYIQDHRDHILNEIEKRRYDPQIVVASNLTSALTLTAICEYLGNRSVKLAPEVIYLDLKGIVS